MFKAKKCFVQRKYSKEDQVKYDTEMQDLLKIVIICLKMENEVHFE